MQTHIATWQPKFSMGILYNHHHVIKQCTNLVICQLRIVPTPDAQNQQRGTALETNWSAQKRQKKQQKKRLTGQDYFFGNQSFFIAQSFYVLI